MRHYCYTFYWSHQRTSQLGFWLAESPGWLPVWSLLRHNCTIRGYRRQLQPGTIISHELKNTFQTQTNYVQSQFSSLLLKYFPRVEIFPDIDLSPNTGPQGCQDWWMLAKIPSLSSLILTGMVTMEPTEKISIICWQTILFSSFYLCYLGNKEKHSQLSKLAGRPRNNLLHFILMLPHLRSGGGDNCEDMSPTLTIKLYSRAAGRRNEN